MKNGRSNNDALIDAMIEEMDEEDLEDTAREALVARVSKMSKKEREDIEYKLVIEPEERADVIHTALLRLAESMKAKDDYLPDGWTKARVERLASRIEDGKLIVVESGE